jgi:hypothetical protein
LSDIAPGRFLSAKDLEAPEVVTIETIVDEEVFNQQTNKKEIKTAMWLEGHERGIIIGAERRNDLIAIFGNVEWSDLEGKQVELYTNEERKKLCIRIRKPGPAPANPAAGATPTAPKPPATSPPAKEAPLNPAQTGFRDTLKRTFTAEQMKDGTAAEKVGEAIVTALGKDYEGDDWRTLSPVQLGSVAEALKVTNPPTPPPDFDELPEYRD